jgi:archaemetzincin
MGIENRINPSTNKIQYNAKSILTELENKLNKNIFCIIGVTMSDLYPREEWNFVFGMASIKKRTGVFSFARYDEDFFEKELYVPDYNKIFYRSVKVMVH